MELGQRHLQLLDAEHHAEAPHDEGQQGEEAQDEEQDALVQQQEVGAINASLLVNLAPGGILQISAIVQVLCD